MPLSHIRTSRLAAATFALAAIGCGVDTDTRPGARPDTPPPVSSTGAPDRAADVVIHRDEWGVPHIKASTDAAVAFGSAWAQCEDHFFQLEDTYIKALGRYAEVVGESGFRSDLEVALFDLVGTSRRDFPGLPENIRRIAEGFAAGYNFYLEKHPGEKPRLLERMEPFHVLAFERYMILGRLLGAAHAPRGRLPRLAEELAASLGSNQWAVGRRRRATANAMLFINPHQPWYGSGMFTEMHVVSDEGLNFSGAMYPGGPLPTAGFNERLGWAYTVNAADISDTYRLTFDHPTDPLKYRYGAGYRDAEEWSATIHVREGDATRAAPGGPPALALRPDHRPRGRRALPGCPRAPALRGQPHGPGAGPGQGALIRGVVRRGVHATAADVQHDLRRRRRQHLLPLQRRDRPSRPVGRLDQARRRRRPEQRVGPVPPHRRAAAGSQPAVRLRPELQLVAVHDH